MTINIGGIKDAIKTILINNNNEDQMANPAPDYYLSLDMVKKVKRIVTVNPDMIRPLANNMPCLAIYFEDKEPVNTNVGMNQVRAQRTAISTFVICGMVWNQNFQADIYDDPADRDLEKMMENVEEILRHHPTIQGLCNWIQPGRVSYHSASFSEQTHFRVAFMELQVKNFY